MAAGGMVVVKSKDGWKGVSEWNALICWDKIVSELFNDSLLVAIMKRAHRQLDRAASGL
jgi:hypothetical protein